MLNVGFISSWHVHTKDYAKAVVESGKARIAAIWDEDEARGRQWAEEWNTEFIASYDDFLARKDIPAVVCDSPTTMHPKLLSKAAAAGKHIFTEKVLAASTADCEALCKAIEDAGITFTISLPLRSNPKMLYAKQLVDSGALGKISGARMRRSHSGVSDRWLPERWFDVESSGGGAMMDLGAHPVYMLAFLFGAPKRVCSLMSNLYCTSSDENAIATVEFENGVIGTCETAFVTYGVPDLLEIYGTEGSLFIHGQDIKVITKSMANLGLDGAAPIRLPEAKPMPIVQFIDACINGTGTPEHLGTADALVMTKIMEAAYASNRDQKTIQL